jgi:hypothetical protein
MRRGRNIIPVSRPAREFRLNKKGIDGLKPVEPAKTWKKILKLNNFSKRK